MSHLHRKAEQQVAAGKTVTHAAVARKLRSRHGDAGAPPRRIFSPGPPMARVAPPSNGP